MSGPNGKAPEGPRLDVEHGMSCQRYRELSLGNGPLTDQEKADGWFFDEEYDGLLANRAWEGHEGFDCQ